MLDGDTHTLNKLSFGHFYILKVVWLQSKVATLYSRRIKLFFKTILPTSYIVCFGLDQIMLWPIQVWLDHNMRVIHPCQTPSSHITQLVKFNSDLFTIYYFVRLFDTKEGAGYNFGPTPKQQTKGAQGFTRLTEPKESNQMTELASLTKKNRRKL